MAGNAVWTTISDHFTISCPSVACGGPSPGVISQSEGWRVGEEGREYKSDVIA